MSRPSGPVHWQLNGYRTACGRSLVPKTDVPIRITGDPVSVTCSQCRRSRKILSAYIRGQTGG